MKKDYDQFQISFAGRGFTTLQIVVVLTIIAILVGLAVPNLADMINRERLKGAAQRAVDELRVARSVALSQNKQVFVSYQAGDEQWCYGLDDEAPCSCNLSNDCAINGGEAIVSHEEFPHISMPKANFAGGVSYTAFDPVRGTPKDNGARNGSIWFQAPNGEQISLVLSVPGRIRLCSPTIAGYTTCAAPTLP